MAEPVNSNKTPPETMHQFIEFCDLGEALRHATAAGFGIQDIEGVCRYAPFGPGQGQLVFRLPDGAPVYFTNEGQT